MPGCSAATRQTCEHSREVVKFSAFRTCAPSVASRAGTEQEIARDKEAVYGARRYAKGCRHSE